MLQPCLLCFLVRELTQGFPLSLTHPTDTQSRLLQHHHIRERSTRLAQVAQLLEADGNSELLAERDMHEVPFGLVLCRGGVVVGCARPAGTFCGASVDMNEAKGDGNRTVFRVLLDDLHNTDNPGLLAIRVVEKGLVSRVHIPHVIPCCTVSVKHDPGSRLAYRRNS